MKADAHYISRHRFMYTLFYILFHFCVALLTKHRAIVKILGSRLSARFAVVTEL